jgi:UDP-2-acetamido-3-amino-2,3-dideoxy-glucuronate N-acetyltransferase
VVRKDQYRKTLVKKGASIGANATIICGVTIGEFAFVGAGSVVNKDVKSFSLVAGNPARHIGWMSEYGHRLEFDANGFAACKESGQKYELKDGFVKRIS